MSTPTTTARALTVADIEAGYEHAEYGGWGYLGEREHAFTDDSVSPQTGEAADRVALRLANEQGMTADQFFAWLNSRPGRHYGDLALHGETATQVEARARRWNLVHIIED